MSRTVASSSEGNAWGTSVSPVRYEFAVGTDEPIFLDTRCVESVSFEDEKDGCYASILHLMGGGYTLDQAYGREGAPKPLYVIEDLRDPGDNRVLYVWPSDADKGEIFDWVVARTEAVEAETGRKTVDGMRWLWGDLPDQ